MEESDSNSLTDLLSVSAEEKHAAAGIDADITHAINYACWQNSVPFIRSLRITNNSSEILSNLRLELTTVPAFAKSKTWTIDRILPGETLPLSDRLVQLDPQFLSGLNEAERGVVQLRLKAGDERTLTDVSHDIRLLARDEWGGFSSMAAIAAAFVMPNDPAVAGILKDAGDVLVAHGLSSALDGYQTGDVRRAFMLGAAIWSAVGARRLTYAEPPKSFEKNGQKVRRPSIIIEQGLATCFDTSLLFASALEAVGLNSFIVLQDDHSFTGFWLVKKTFPNLLETDPAEVRKALAAREAVTFETTAITQSPPATFDAAITMARKATREDEEYRFVAAIDVARARAAQILPLASHNHETLQSPDDEAREGVALPLPPAPDFSSLPAEEAEEKPTTPEGRIDRWQHKLLDLSLRNRLLNFRPTKQTIPFLCPDVPFLEDRLAEQAKIRIISLPEQNPQGERDKAIHLQATGKDLDTEFALDALQRDELSSQLEPRELDARLTGLFRRAKNDLNEGGSNTLFLAVGFLKWKKSPEDERSYRAPLLLVPVKLDRRSAASRFHLLHHEDEVRFNATLVQMLKKDFDLNLSQFDGGLPQDQSGIDVPLVLETMRRAVRDIAGFEVVNETALSTFSFAKYLMWKDLVDRIDALRNNRVVRHLIDNPDKAFEPGVATAFPDERQVDIKYHPRDIINPLPADSSQLAAVLAAAEGHDFVLIGPPGTGKSQTITNMIAQCLASGKSVLFVAEKTAALNVVYRRLREHGLGDYCLELHSNKAERKAFLGQLKASWETAGEGDQESWVEINEKLKVRGDELNGYVEALHRTAPCGWTIFKALGISVRHADRTVPKPAWEETTEHDENAIAALRQLVADLSLTRKALKPLPALKLVAAPDWSVGWQQEFIDACMHLKQRTTELSVQLGDFSSAVGLAHSSNLSFANLREVVELANLLQKNRGRSLSTVFDKRFNELKASVDDLEEGIRLFSTASHQLAGAYPEEEIERIPVDDLERDWREASAAIWPKSVFGKRRVQKLLQTYARGGNVDPEQDLPQLRAMQHCLAGIDQMPLSENVPEWQGINTDTEKLRDHISNAEAMRSTLVRIGQISNDISAVARAVAPAVTQGATTDPIFEKAIQLRNSMQQFLQAAHPYQELGGKFLADTPNANFLDRFAAALNEIVENRTALQAWTEWYGLREKANARGVSPLVEAVESNKLTPEELGEAFELSYARWWLPKAIDRDPVLRRFKAFKHEEALRQFRELDDKARFIAARQVRRSLTRDLPKPHEVARRSELGLLRHQMELQRPSKSIREMISAMPESFGKLAPCLLMSPLSIAQYLPAEQAQFDVVIFDEASQITTWDAVGSIARGRQTIIVGDPKQLPPTNFFGRSDDGDGAADGQAYYEKDLESILDEAKASGLPHMQLNWHYRSRHESLIAFSNWHYYQNRLVTFPSPVTSDRAVRFEHQPSGVYDRGKSRTNKIEAEAIVRDACDRMVEWLDLPEEERPTLGVITFNSQQQSLIDDLFDDARRNNPAFEWFFSDDRLEPVIVRNLENVQGDERDVMMFSITYGPDHAGKITMSFGAINNDGGERRMNVAITRAREELVVYSSITADQIDISRTKSLGVRHLKTFLDYAERGPIALPAEDDGSVGTFESPFEEAVAQAISDTGWTVVPQIGVSGFRVDLGIVHPDRPGAYLAGIECDGATYHRAATARDRDKVREQVLRNLGWEIIRIWSPDWWYDSKEVLTKVKEELARLLDASRQAEAQRKATAEARAAEKAAHAQAAANEDLHTANPTANGSLEIAAIDLVEDNDGNSPDTIAKSVEEHGEESDVQRVASLATASEVAKDTLETARFRKTDLSGSSADPDRFYDFNYRGTIRGMVAAVLEAEAPVREDVLAQRIARAHGWLRTGSRIRDQIALHLKDFDTTNEEPGRFLWQKGTVTDTVEYRQPASDEDRRPVSEIAIAELIGFVRENPDLLDEPDPALTFARLIGLDRLALVSRNRLEEAVRCAGQMLQSDPQTGQSP